MVDNFITLDKNMLVDKMGDIDVVWNDVRKPPFKIYGLYQPETEAWFHRMPMDVATATSRLSPMPRVFAAAMGPGAGGMNTWEMYRPVDSATVIATEE